MDGKEALELLESMSDKPDVILLDVMMPGMSGFEVRMCGTCVKRMSALCEARRYSAGCHDAWHAGTRGAKTRDQGKKSVTRHGQSVRTQCVKPAAGCGEGVEWNSKCG